MPYNATVFKVMIASPSDVAEERTVIREVLAEWNAIHSDSGKVVFLPVGWETHTSPEMGGRAQEIINRQIAKDCDLLVGVFWTRIGTETGDYVSGAVEEIEEHIKAGKPVMLYFSTAPIAQEKVDPDQYAALKVFKESCKSRGLYASYVDIGEFKNAFSRQLQLKLKHEAYFVDYFRTSAQGADSDSSSETFTLSEDARVLLKEAVQDANGQINCLPITGGFQIITNGKPFGEDRRSMATWESALEELNEAGMLVSRGYNNEAFSVTREGYEYAELLDQ